MPPTLTSAERRRLRALAHPLAPLAQVGRQGLSDPFVAELDRALESHELIKMRLRGEREERDAQLAELCERLSCAVVGTVGSVAILFRATDRRAAAAESRT
jgi:RNA-binding protein